MTYRQENRKKIIITITIAVVVIIMLYLYSAIDPEDSNLGRFFPKCLLKQLTGLQCPGCGIQRAAHALLQGDLYGALACNWFLVFSLSYLAGLILTKYFSSKKSRVRRFFWGKPGCTLYISLYLIWFVVRNILGI